MDSSLTTLALCSLQTTPARWVATHRLHHNHSDDPEDPHSPEETFFVVRRLLGALAKR